MYGGRVIDGFDRRVVATYMGEYMGDFIFDTFQPFHFYHDEKVDYFIPRPQLEDKKKKSGAAEDGDENANKKAVTTVSVKKSKKKGRTLNFWHTKIMTSKRIFQNTVHWLWSVFPFHLFIFIF